MCQARTLALMCAVLVLLSVATVPIPGQAAVGGTLKAGPNGHVAVPAPSRSFAPAATPAQQLNRRVYAPLVMTSAVTAGPFFESTTTCGTTFDPPVTPPATLAYGIRQLTAFATVRNGAGLLYSIEWKVNNTPRPDLDINGVLSSNLQDISRTLIATSPLSNEIRCDQEIPRATYEVTVKIDGQVVGTGVVVIQ